MAGDNKRANNELVRWSILVGAAMTNDGFRKELFAAVRAGDACSEWHTSVLSGIERDDRRQVLSQVGSLIGGDVKKGETSLAAILRSVTKQVTDDRIKRAMESISCPSNKIRTPQEFSEHVERQLGIIKECLGGKEANGAAGKQKAS